MSIRNRLGSLRRHLLAPFQLRSSISELQSLLPETVSGEALWRVTQQYAGCGPFRSLRAWQVEAEFCQLVDFVLQRQPRVILEIGTCAGGTLLAWSRIATEYVVSVDLPGGIDGGGYPPLKQRLYRQLTIGHPSVQSLILQADSQSLATRDRVQAALGGRGIDFLFIDGDHRYAGVSRDFELWSPLVSPGGYVGFHDILPQSNAPNCQVDRLWCELRARFDCIEIIADRAQRWAGIGILRIPRQPARVAPI